MPGQISQTLLPYAPTQRPSYHIKGIYTMNKAELVSAIASKAGLTKADTESLLNTYMEVVTETLKKGDTITLVGFGTYKVSHRKETTGVTPRTKEKIKIPAKKVAAFKFSPAVNEQLKKK